jgi:hypothetical protein
MTWSIKTTTLVDFFMLIGVYSCSKNDNAYGSSGGNGS